MVRATFVSLGSRRRWPRQNLRRPGWRGLRPVGEERAGVVGIPSSRMQRRRSPCGAHPAELPPKCRRRAPQCTRGTRGHPLHVTTKHILGTYGKFFNGNSRSICGQSLNKGLKRDLEEARRRLREQWQTRDTGSDNHANDRGPHLLRVGAGTLPMGASAISPYHVVCSRRPPKFRRARSPTATAAPSPPTRAIAVRGVPAWAHAPDGRAGRMRYSAIRKYR